MSSHQCPECNRQLKPNAQFCSYCGVSLKNRQKEEKMPTTPTATTDLVQANDSIPAAVETALILRGKLENFCSQKAALDEEQETLKVKQLVGELSEKEAKNQIDELQQKMAPIIKEIEELENKASTPLEQLQQEKKIQEGRLHRLEELRNSKEVEDIIYQRLSSEYSSKLDEINHQLESQISQANHWLVQLEERKKQLEFDRETLQVRVKIDDVSKRDVKSQLSLIDGEINKLTSIISGLRSLLGTSVLLPKKPVSKIASSSAQKTVAKTPMENCSYCQAKITVGSKYCYTCGRLLSE